MQRYLVLAGGLFLASGIALAIALALNGNPWTSVFGGAPAAAWIAAAIIAGTAAAVGAAFEALRSWYQCITSSSGPVCNSHYVAALSALAFVIAALISQAAAVAHAAPGSFVPWFNIPVLTTVLIALGVQAAALGAFGFTFNELIRCIFEQVGSTSSPISRRPPGGGGSVPPTRPPGRGSGRRVRIPDLEHLLTTRRWIRDPVHGVPVPFPPGPDDCVACLTVIASTGQLIDVVASDGKLERLVVDAGDVVAFDMEGLEQPVSIPVAEAKASGASPASPRMARWKTRV